jgi:hypothetical protein
MSAVIRAIVSQVFVSNWKADEQLGRVASVVPVIGPAGLRAFHNANHPTIVFYHQVSAVDVSYASDLLALNASRTSCMATIWRETFRLALAILMKVDVILWRII